MTTETAPAADTFIPLTEPGAEASGASSSMTETIRLALDSVKDMPDDDDTPVAKEPEKDDIAEKPAKEEPAKAEEKPEDKPAKPRGEGGKFAAKEPDAKPVREVEPKAEAEAEEGHGPKINPPAKLLPDAREKWINTPRPVQRDIENMVREYESTIETARKDTERYEALRQFDDLAKQNGRDLRESLLKINHIENQLQSNPIAGLNAILAEIGPRKADGSPLSLYEVANVIVQQGPQGYQQAIAQANRQMQVQQRDSEAERLRQENEALKAERFVSDIDARIVSPFKQTHPRFGELHDDIAFFLKSGRIPEGLSHLDRLEAAYAMAERLNPSPGSSQSQSDALDRSDRVDLDSSGRKSIRSSPGAVSPSEDSVDSKDMTAVARAALRKAMGTA
jgi:hypothetical protein